MKLEIRSPAQASICLTSYQEFLESVPPVTQAVEAFFLIWPQAVSGWESFPFLLCYLWWHFHWGQSAKRRTRVQKGKGARGRCGGFDIWSLRGIENRTNVGVISLGKKDTFFFLVWPLQWPVVTSKDKLPTILHVLHARVNTRHHS